MGRVFLNQAFFWSLPFRLIDPLCYEFFLAWVSDYLDHGEMGLNTELVGRPRKGVIPHRGMQSFSPRQFLPVF